MISILMQDKNISTRA